MPNPTTSSTIDPTAPAFTQALDSVRDEAARVPEAQLVPIRVDVPRAVLTAIGAAPVVRTHRDAIVATFGEADAANIDRLETLARAAGQAHAAHLAVTSVDLEPLAKKVVEVRTRLVTDAESLVQRRVLGHKALSNLVGGQAYTDRCWDVLQVVAVFRSNWDAASAATTVTIDDLNHAEAAANILGTALSERDQAEAGTSASALLRARTFTLFYRAYDEARRMLGYLRWNEGDVDSVAPSLYAGRATRKRDAPPTDATETPADTIAPGMPGASPFINA